MTVKEIADRDDVFARQYDYDDERLFVADLGVSTEASADVLGDTAIVVFEDGAESRQMEIPLPGSGAEAFITNGILTVEVGP